MALRYAEQRQVEAVADAAGRLTKGVEEVLPGIQFVTAGCKRAWDSSVATSSPHSLSFVCQSLSTSAQARVLRARITLTSMAISAAVSRRSEAR